MEVEEDTTVAGVETMAEEVGITEEEGVTMVEEEVRLLLSRRLVVPEASS